MPRAIAFALLVTLIAGACRDSHASARAGQSASAPLRACGRPLLSQSGPVSDFAQAFTPDQDAAMDTVIRLVRARSRGDIAVVTLPTLNGCPIDSVARQIARGWHVGSDGPSADPKVNTGLVLLLAPGDGQVWLQYGGGTARFISTADARRIVDSVMAPHFERGDFGGGAVAGVRVVAAAYGKQYGFEVPEDHVSGAAPASVRPVARDRSVPGRRH